MRDGGRDLEKRTGYVAVNSDLGSAGKRGRQDQINPCARVQDQGFGEECLNKETDRGKNKNRNSRKGDKNGEA